MVSDADEGRSGGASGSGSCAHVIDIIEQSGPLLVAKCYWDFGPWSDLHRLHRNTPTDDADEPVDIRVRRGLWGGRFFVLFQGGGEGEEAELVLCMP